VPLSFTHAYYMGGRLASPLVVPAEMGASKYPFYTISPVAFGFANVLLVVRAFRDFPNYMLGI